MIKKIGLFILCFLFVFGPKYKGSSWVDTSLFVCVLIIGAGLLTNGKIASFVFKFIAPLLLLSFYILIIRPLTGRVSVSQLANELLKPVRIGIILLAAQYLYFWFSDLYRSKTITAILTNFFFVIVLHASLMIFQFFYPEFKDWIYEYTSEGDYRSSFDYALRMGGLSGGSGGAVLSVVMSIGLVLIPFLWKSTNKLILIIGGAVVLLSILVCGRSGLWSTMIFLPLGGYMAAESKWQFFKVTAISILIIISIVGPFFAYVAINAQFAEGGQLGIVNAFSRTFDTFLYASERSDAQQVFSEMVMLPSDLRIFLIGEPYFLIDGNTRRELNSDMGYIRGLWSLGLIGLTLFFWPFTNVLFKTFISSATSKIHLCLRVVLLVTLFFHSKELFLYTRMLFPLTAILIIAFMFERSHNEKIHFISES